MAKVFKEPKSYIQRVLMRSISRMNPSNWAEEVTPTPPGPAPVKLTPFNVGDVVTTIKFDTSKESELVDLLNTLFTENPNEDQITLVSYDLASTTTISPDGPIVAAANTGNGVYTLITGNGDVPVPIYSTGEFNIVGITGVQGWQNLDGNNTFTLNFSGEDLTVVEINSKAANVNGVVFGK